MAIKSRAETVIGRLFARSAMDINPYAVLAQARYKVSQRTMIGRSKNEYKDLEDFLNYYYGSHSTSQTVMDGANKFQTAIISFINREIKTQKTIDSKFHTQSIKGSTIIQECQYIQKILDNPKLQFGKIFNKGELQSLISLIESMFAQAHQQEFILSLQNPAMKEISQLIATLDYYYAVAKSFSPDVSQAYGEGFEASLQAIDTYINQEAVPKTLEQIFLETMTTRQNETTTGAQPTNRGTLSSTILQMSNKQNKVYSYNIDNTVNSWVQIKGQPFAETSGKMDIYFRLPGLEQGFRVSAKNWETKNGRDFGSSNLQNVMLRTVNVDMTLEYGLVVGYYGARGRLYPWLRAHEFAKVCALVDILMGYSQENSGNKGYADTIIINDRSNPIRPIQVYSIYEILDRVSNNLQALENKEYIRGYVDNDINNKLRFSNPKQAINELLTKMHAIKLTLSSKILDM